MVAGDSYAHIIRNKENTKIINIKPLNPGKMKIVVDGAGMIKRYEQITKNPTKGIGNKIKNAFRGKEKVHMTFEPNEIFHLSYNRMADQIHGLSKIDAIEPIIKADEEMFTVTSKVMRQQAIPFIIFKYKTDNEDKIGAIVNKIRKIREKYDDLHIPDDENLLSWEVVQISPSQILLTYQDNLRNKFYRAIGLPQLVPGGGGASTDSDARVIYLAFEQLVTQRQLYLQKQTYDQLGWKLRFNPPTTIISFFYGNTTNI